MKPTTALVAFALMAGMAMQIAEAAPARARRGAGKTNVSVVVPLTDDETSSLVQLRQEEKLARDVYLALHKTWGLRIFANIAASEQRHMDAVGNLLARYGVEDPVADDTAGVFADDEFTELYETLVEIGSESAVAALGVGALIEDLDIADLESASAGTDKEDILLVYSRLMAGSENHLRAFVKWLASYGETYTPQYITLERFEEIIAAATSRGR